MARPKGFDTGFGAGFGAFPATAELLIKVGDSPNPNGFKDGDIIAAHNNRRIRHVHAENICWGRVNGKKKGGGWLVDPLLEKFLEKNYQYKFVRTGHNTATRTNLATLAVDNISKDNADPDLRMDVDLYVKRRMAAKKKPVFGVEGAEVWYGGNQRAGHSELDDVWDQIEADTGILEENRKKYPLTLAEKKNYLVITVDDFDDAEAGVLTETEVDGQGVITKKRKRQIEWRKLSGVVEADVLDKTKVVDLRGTKYVRNSHVKVKT